MAAILFLVVILGLLAAGRAQALSSEDGSALRFELWQLAVAGLVCLAQFALGTPVRVIAVIAVLGLFAFRSRARRYHDIEDF
jgi:hypothetical protein